MEVKSITSARITPNHRVTLATPDEQLRANVTNIYNIHVSTAPPQQATAEPAEKKQPTTFQTVKEAGGEVTKIAAGGGLLLTNMNNATAPQLAGILQQYHLVGNPDIAATASKNILETVQSQGANAILIGGVAGTATYAALDKLRPAWSTRRKLGWALAVAAVFTSLAYFTAQNSPSQTSPTARGASK